MTSVSAAQTGTGERELIRGRDDIWWWPLANDVTHLSHVSPRVAGASDIVPIVANPTAHHETTGVTKFG